MTQIKAAVGSLGLVKVKIKGSKNIIVKLELLSENDDPRIKVT